MYNKIEIERNINIFIRMLENIILIIAYQHITSTKHSDAKTHTNCMTKTIEIKIFTNLMQLSGISTSNYFFKNLFSSSINLFM